MRRVGRLGVCGFIICTLSHDHIASDTDHLPISRLLITPSQQNSTEHARTPNLSSVDSFARTVTPSFSTPLLLYSTIPSLPNSFLLSQADNRPEPEPEDKLEGMAGALARALAERNKVLAVDSDKSDSESDDDWSD